MAGKTTKTTTEKATTVKFTKDQLRKSKKYSADVDILGVMLKDGESYTFDEADNLINEFKKRSVK